MITRQSDPRETFREEARELLVDLEQALLSLENDPENRENVDRAFRDLHTLKGSGNMFGFQDLADFAHAVENAFVAIREGKQRVAYTLISVSLRARDHISRLLEETPLTTEEETEQGDILSTLVEEYSGATGGNLEISHETTGSDETGGEMQLYRISFAPSRETFIHGTDPLGLISELEELGDTQVIGSIAEVPEILSLDPELCYLQWDVILNTKAERSALEDVFIFLDEESRVEIQEIDKSEAFDESGTYKRLGDILVDRGDISSEELERILGRKNQIGALLVQEGVLPEDKVEGALEEQRFIRSLRERQTSFQKTTSIKVQVERLDTMINLVGEFVSLQSQIAMRVGLSGDRELIALSEQLERLVREIRDLSIEMHMIPVETLFSPFRRLVRDLGGDLGKEVDLKISGTETELDKNMIEELRDPLLHIVRNAIDHGIEDEDIRRAAGKPERGKISLSARYSGALVIIDVEDDGAGIDIEGVRGKAVERGIIDEGATLTDEQVIDLIFTPGFSTVTNATQLSGRGVGMDVVRRNVEALNGSVSIQSVPGEGSRFQLRMPLTLAIVEGLLARIGGTFYLINLAYIVECLDLHALRRESKRDLFDYRGSVVPILDMRKYFNEPVEERGQVVIVGNGADRVGLVVDELFDNYQSVVKSLGKLYEGVEGLSGAVFLGDGTPALMLDVERLIRKINRSSSNGSL